MCYYILQIWLNANLKLVANRRYFQIKGNYPQNFYLTVFEVIDDIANKIQMAYVLYKNNFKTTDYTDYNIFRVEKTGKKTSEKMSFFK